MKIVWFCIPAYGHTNPTLGLVKALTERGHIIYYFSFEMFREKIESVGAQFFPCDGYSFEMEGKENADRVGKDQAFAVQNDNETNTIVYTSKYFQPCAESFSDRYHFIGPSMRPITETYEKTAEKTVFISMGTNPDHFDDLPEQDAVAKRAEEVGAGLRLPSIGKEDVLKTVTRVIEEQSFTDAAKKVSDSFKQSGGIDEAVAFIESVGGA